MYIAKNKDRSILVILLSFLYSFMLPGCKPEKVEPILPLPYTFAVPSNFPEPAYTFQNNKVTKAGFELGRELFYDPILSRDNSVSCGTCHKQYAAFSDYQHPLSHGIDDQFTTRNSTGIFNVAWNTSFMWDGGINHIEVMPIAPITNPLEMDETLANVLYKLNNHSTYPEKFKQAFGIDQITSKEVLLAFAQFMGMMISSNSKFDKYQRNEQGGTMTQEELNGMALFQNKCGSCHEGVLQTNQSFRNNGLDDDFTNDYGRYLITGQEHDKGKFKVPSLRNAYITPPYMHDGRFETLEEVIDHYRFSVKQSSTLDPLLATGLQLSEEEKQSIIAFIKTLTDNEFTKDEKFKEPIK